MRITAQDLLKLGIVDQIITEPAGGAHSDRDLMIQSVGDALEAELKALGELSAEALKRQRADRYYAIGSKGL